MKRNPRKLGWTKAFRRAHGKEMTVDSTLAMAQRRNIPVRYNRDLVAKTLEAMRRIGEIRSRRERQFYRLRMRGVQERDLEEDRKLVAENQHLLPPQYRDQVKEALEETAGVKEMEGVEVEDEEVELKNKQSQQVKVKRKQRLVRGKGVEEEEDMDVDN